jgi:hypothetical protein
MFGNVLVGGQFQPTIPQLRLASIYADCPGDRQPEFVRRNPPEINTYFLPIISTL